MSSLKFCVVIPYYNHGERLFEVVDAISLYKLPIIIVNDGCSEEESHSTLAALADKCTVINLVENSGKGVALARGFRHALSQGFSHAVCVDADGQHNCKDISKFMDAAQSNPEALILGSPKFDASAPWERVWGRKLSTLMVWLQTRSRVMDDVLCGFRCYPLQTTVGTLGKINSSRMGFEIESLVHHAWRGLPIINVETAVIYPKDGRSHFKYLRDNFALIRLHTALLTRGLIRGVKNKYWFERKELGSKAGLKLLITLYSIVGRRVTEGLLYPISLIYLLSARSARDACFCHHEHLSKVTPVKTGKWQHAFKTFHFFARSIMDSILAWKGQLRADKIRWANVDVVNNLIKSKQGAVVLTAHFGPVEAARALHRFKGELSLYALMHTDNAKKYQSVLELVFPDAHRNVIPVSEVNMATFSILQSKISQGAFLGLMGDRLTPNGKEKYIERTFLGETAFFPVGPFLMAAVLNVPVLTMFVSYREDSEEFTAEWNDITPDLNLDRKARIESLVDSYVKQLEQQTKRFPQQFFNFFDFWRLPTGMSVRGPRVR